MNNFKQGIKPLQEVRKENEAMRLFKFSYRFALFALVMFGIYGVVVFFSNYSLQIPIVFQSPIVKIKTDLTSPVGSKSAGLIRRADAAEVKNPFDVRSPRGIAWELNKTTFGIEQWDAFETLIFKESGWNPYAINSTSGACGLGQSLPCSKMDCEMWDYSCQIAWITNYIENRYQTPTKALVFHYKNNWY